jgi:hypothetical protein
MEQENLLVRQEGFSFSSSLTRRFCHNLGVVNFSYSSNARELNYFTVVTKNINTAKEVEVTVFTNLSVQIIAAEV